MLTDLTDSIRSWLWSISSRFANISVIAAWSAEPIVEPIHQQQEKFKGEIIGDSGLSTGLSWGRGEGGNCTY